MKYRSTRDTEGRLYSAPDAICAGIAPDGGLFVPEYFPRLRGETLTRLSKLDYAARAAEILGMYFDCFGSEQLGSACEAAYSPEVFSPCPAPISLLGETAVLELWHGPTCAFKDIALQIMPRLLTMSMRARGESRTAHIVTATSGDTGEAALEGFRDLPGTKITVFYPTDGVSRVQKLQMATQEGDNVDVVAIRGNFDDAQSAVKAIFADPEVREAAEKKGEFLSSANSINIARLVPQTVYYISAYLDLLAEGYLVPGEELDIAVPTGNFGDILAAYMAKRMGLPVGKMVCCSNRNRILTDFFETGVYDTRREFFTTTSPSMDILISSNLERLLYFAFGAEKTAECMRSLRETGVFSIDGDMLETLRADFSACSADEFATAYSIRDTFARYGYTADPHTAAALSYAVGKKCLAVSTASPFKFAPAVDAAIGANGRSMQALRERTGMEIPGPLAGLEKKKIRFTRVVDKADIKTAVYGLQ